MIFIFEIEVCLKVKCDRFVFVFEIDEIGEFYIYIILSFLLLVLIWCFGCLVRFVIFFYLCCEFLNICI